MADEDCSDPSPGRHPARDGATLAVGVVGGGLVGSLLGIALARARVPVAVIEVRPWPLASAARSGAGGEFSAGSEFGMSRPIALAKGSQRVLSRLGLWDDLAPAAHPIRRIHVSEQGGWGATRLSAERLGVDALGYVASAANLDAVVARACRRQSGLLALRPARVTSVVREPDQVRLQVDGESERRQSFNARLVAFADGLDSHLRESLGLKQRPRDYGQRALVAEVELDCGHDDTAYERFTADGPLALLPTGRARFAVVWAGLPARIQGLGECADASFCQALIDAFGGRFPGLRLASERATVELRGARTAAPLAGRVALIGNAAQSLHPVAGQGLNLGIRDLCTLAEMCAQVMAGGGDPGSPDLLRAFARSRELDRRLTASFTDFLAWGFIPRAVPPSWSRSLGLAALDILPGAKDALARHAMGISPPVPRLMRGLDLDGPWR